jgi:hypothetical protein
METNRLRKLQQPCQVEVLLNALVSGSNLLPQGAYRIHQPSSVPKELRRIALRATQKGQVWLCWAHTFNTWLLIGEMSLPLSRERGMPVLLVNLYDDGGLKDSAPWMADRSGKWCRCDE